MSYPVFGGYHTFVLSKVGAPPGESAVADDGDVGMLYDLKVDNGAVALEMIVGLVLKIAFDAFDVIADKKHFVLVEVWY